MGLTKNEIGVICLELRQISKLPAIQRVGNRAADIIEDMGRELRDCRNQLCLYCGSYKEAHLGACEGCRWKH